MAVHERNVTTNEETQPPEKEEEEVYPLVPSQAFEIEPTKRSRPAAAPLLVLLFSSFRVRVFVLLLPLLGLAGIGGYFIHRHSSRIAVRFRSGVPRYDKAFQLALREVAGNIQADGTFMAGAGWTQLWTRDTSYALELSLALLYPQESERTLRKLTQESSSTSGPENFGRTWYQDECGHFGGWPHLSDAIVGAQGSWSLYLATGDVAFLEWAHNITQNTLRWAETDVLDPHTNLFKGCSSFMESNSGYPSEYRMNGHMVGETKALSTNVLYYTGYKVAANMTWELQRVAAKYQPNPSTSYDLPQLLEKAQTLKTAITERLWMEDKGYYAYLEDAQQSLVTQMEGLGESLLLLAPDLETNATRIKRILEETPRTSNGIACLWPPFDLLINAHDPASYYHNGRIWPFVQGYWAIAAARHGRVGVFAQEFNNLVHLALSSPSTGPKDIKAGRENGPTFAEFYETNATHLWARRRQLWSSAGFLGMVLQGLFGMQMEPKGIRFRPVKPKHMKRHSISLERLAYRQAELTIRVSGRGTVVERFAINKKVQKEPFLAATAEGEQLIEIVLKEEE